jgi:thiol-disulfide isomerase/thioredoxin
VKRKPGIALVLVLLTLLFGATGGAMTFAAPLLSPGAAQNRHSEASIGAEWGSAPEFLTGRVETDTGRRVRLSSVDRTILFFAPWCPHCHRVLESLIARHELGRVQLVAVGMNWVLSDGTHGEVVANPNPPRTREQMESFVKQQLRAAGVVLPWQQVDFAPPNGLVNRSIRRYPTFALYRDGKYSVVIGMNRRVKRFLEGGE